jgi:hypothetical protein
MYKEINMKQTFLTVVFLIVATAAHAQCPNLIEVNTYTYAYQHGEKSIDITMRPYYPEFTNASAGTKIGYPPYQNINNAPLLTFHIQNNGSLPLWGY